VAVATAQILFQRFYYKKSFVHYDFHYTALGIFICIYNFILASIILVEGCILLAAKIEECPVHCRPIINVYNYVKQKREKGNIYICGISLLFYFFNLYMPHF
jgi:hypothetical protein